MAADPNWGILQERKTWFDVGRDYTLASKGEGAYDYLTQALKHRGAEVFACPICGPEHKQFNSVGDVRRHVYYMAVEKQRPERTHHFLEQSIRNGKIDVMVFDDQDFGRFQSLDDAYQNPAFLRSRKYYPDAPNI